jgi:hypothetical protein
LQAFSSANRAQAKAPSVNLGAFMAAEKEDRPSTSELEPPFKKPRVEQTVTENEDYPEETFADDSAGAIAAGAPDLYLDTVRAP